MFRVRTNHYERILAERERLIQKLAEENNWLRNMLSRNPGNLGAAVATPVVPETTQPVIELDGLPPGVDFKATNSLSDDEEQLAAMKQLGAITPAEHAAALERLRAGVSDSDIIE